LGAEGCGIIEALGKDLKEEDYLHKKVSFCWGAWSQYVIQEIDQVIIFKNKEVDPAVAAYAFINPLSALCLLDMAEKFAKEMMKK
jgi:NADPH:quinone reductase-like Zn-dependent oxidoreductase